ncbi:MAG: hypothetical protein DHS80DRAFT_25167 [Piptocephalis tieghemiana]|nr:MAG: hypothetical protein DHS80DRAFT_25167 [Piptocephalis tieghemiana]
MSSVLLEKTTTPGEYTILVTLVRVTGSLGLAGSLIPLILRFTCRRFRHHPLCITTMLVGIANLISTIPKVIGIAGPRQGPTSALCQAQATLMEWGDLASLLLVVSTSLKALYFVRAGSLLPLNLVRRQTFWFALSFTLPIPLLIIALAVRGEVTLPDGTTARVPLIGDTGLWCWIRSEFIQARLWLFYIPLWVTFLGMLSIYTFIGVRIWESARPVDRHARRHHQCHPQLHSFRQDMGGKRATIASCMTCQAQHPDSPGMTSPGIRSLRFKYFFTVIIIIIAHIISWFPLSIYRIYEMANAPSMAPFGLRLLVALFVPLRGLTDSVVMVAAILRPQKPSDTTVMLSSSIGGGGRDEGGGGRRASVELDFDEVYGTSTFLSNSPPQTREPSTARMDVEELEEVRSKRSGHSGSYGLHSTPTIHWPGGRQLSVVQRHDRDTSSTLPFTSNSFFSST